MKRLLFCLGLVLVIAGYSVPLVSAHVLKIDGDIGAILHINPDDNPMSGVPTTYVLSFSDTTNRFDLHLCDCIATLTDSTGTIVKRQPLAVTYNLDSEDAVTFPQPDVYTLTVVGKPLASQAFQTFKLAYIIHVTGSTTNGQSVPPLLILGNVLLLAFIFLAVYSRSRRTTGRQ